MVAVIRGFARLLLPSRASGKSGGDLSLRFSGSLSEVAQNCCSARSELTPPQSRAVASRSGINGFRLPAAEQNRGRGPWLFGWWGQSALRAVDEVLADRAAAQARADYYRRRRDAWIDRYVAMERRERTAQRFLAQVVTERNAAAERATAMAGRVGWLEGELGDMTRSRDEFLEIADRLRKDAAAAAAKKGRK